MSKTPSKLREVMIKHGITPGQLAIALGLTDRTIHNISCGNSRSRAARQKITDFFATQIWPDIKPQTSMGMIAESTVFLRLTDEQAQALHQKFPATTRVVQSGGDVLGPCMVEFLADTPAIVSLKNPNSPPPLGASRYSSLPRPILTDSDPAK